VGGPICGLTLVATVYSEVVVVFAEVAVVETELEWEGVHVVGSVWGLQCMLVLAVCSLLLAYFGGRVDYVVGCWDWCACIGLDGGRV